jgi:NAD(P)-dependent dehydrogenase (short-subunit alcohol dehydrogenase family)
MMASGRTQTHFENTVVLVTGAARGLGRAVALEFATRGAAVSAVDIDADALYAVARELQTLGTRTCAIRADVSRPDDAYSAVERTVEELGRLDVVINNAGTASVQPLLEITEDEWDKVFAVNVKGVLFTLQAAARYMKENGGGRIINVTSPASRMALPNYSAYAASKAAVDSITRAAAVALGRFAITVNAVAPGRMDTDMQRWTEQKFAALAGVDVGTFVHDRTKSIPLGRRTCPEEVAAAIVWLAGPQAAYITGERLNISGGLEVE